MLIETTAESEFRLRLSVESAQGQTQRELTFASCDEARESAIVLIAMTLQGASATLQDPAPEAEASTNQALPDNRQTTPDDRQTTNASNAVREPTPIAVRGGISLGLHVDPISLGRASAGPSLGMSLSLGPFELSARAHYLVARPLSHLPDMAKGELEHFGAALGAAYTFERPHVYVGPLAELELGVLRASVSNVPDARRERALWASLFAGMLLEYPAKSRWAARLIVEGGVPFYRPRFGLKGGPVSYTAPPALFRTLFGVVVRWGPKG